MLLTCFGICVLRVVWILAIVPLRPELSTVAFSYPLTWTVTSVMFIVYYVSITTVGGFLTDWTNDTLFGEWIVPGARTLLENIHCAGWLTGLVVDGIISGVGAVLGFVPQMLVLFISWHSLSPVDICHVSSFIMDRISVIRIIRKIIHPNADW